MVAEKSLPLLEAEAKERMSRAAEIEQSNCKNQGKERIPDPGQARDKAAKLVGVNPRYVSDAKMIRKESPELAAKVEAGEMTIPVAYWREAYFMEMTLKNRRP